MVNAYIIISALITAVLISGVIKMNKVKKDVTRHIQVLYLLAVIIVIFNVLSVYSSNKSISLLCYGLYCSATVWFAIQLLVVTNYYIGGFKEILVVKLLVIIFAMLDTLSLTINAYTLHAFDMKWVDVLGVDHCYSITEFSYPYYLHFLLLYGILAMVVIAIVCKAYNSPEVYKIKYYSILVYFVILLCLDFSYKSLHLPINISCIIFSIIAFTVSYFMLYHVPKGLVADILDNAVEWLDNGIICFDSEGKCIYYNSAAADYYGIDKANGVEKTILINWLGANDAATLDKHSKIFDRQLGDEVCNYKITFNPIKNEKANYIGCFLMIEDITDTVNKIERERFRATHDSLTHSLNRNGFFEAVRLLLDRDPDTSRIMMVSDIRNFKLVNELFGTMRGDSILIHTAELLKKNVAPDSIYGRLDSDRFALCMRKDSFNEKIFVDAINELASMANNSVYRMHIHLGIYEITDTSLDVSVMCDKAIMAIKRNKDNLAAITCYYDEKMSRDYQEDCILLNEFDDALEEGQFQMFLQPQISTVNYELLGAEALVRWIHPTKGIIPPIKFIPLFENSGYIYRLDRYIWECACKQLRRWKDKGMDKLHISVNISPKDLFYIDIYKTFTELVEKYDIEPSRLKLELTETAIINNIEAQKDTFDRLHEYGFEIEIDDFGSGYSSLNTLKELKVDVLKLDMGFLGETMQNERSRIILNSVVAMSKELGLMTVTEGVETKEQIVYLTGVGCDILQGYYFSKPIPVDEFEKKYELV